MSYSIYAGYSRRLGVLPLFSSGGDLQQHQVRQLPSLNPNMQSARPQQCALCRGTGYQRSICTACIGSGVAESRTTCEYCTRGMDNGQTCLFCRGMWTNVQISPCSNCSRGEIHTICSRCAGSGHRSLTSRLQ